MNTSKDTETINEDGAVEINVETVDYRKPAGQDQEPEKEKVDITHVYRPEDDKPGNVVTDAAGKLGEKLQSAKEAVSEKVAETLQSAKKVVSEYAAAGKKADEKTP